MADGFVSFCDNYVVYNAKVGGCIVNRVSPALCKWLPPPHNHVKINVDAHVLGENGVGLGVVIRDEAGKLLLTVVKRRCCRWLPELAEAVGAVCEKGVLKG